MEMTIRSRTAAATTRVDRAAPASPSKSRQAWRDENRDVVSEAEKVAAHRQYTELKTRRLLAELRDRKATQREIAEALDISQPEVSRRLKRLRPGASAIDPMEIILSQRAGMMSRSKMMRELLETTYTSVTPGQDAGLDGAAPSTGTARQLSTAFQRGLLTKTEYEKLRGSVTVKRSRAA